jgi:resuscitation-promoting factor RpfB
MTIMATLRSSLLALALATLLPAGCAPDATSDNCDENYEPCVPIAVDVDCPNGDGDGPAYAPGPVRVVGRDKYDLDTDGDGIGCDS